jgi:hypothetical protein
MIYVSKHISFSLLLILLITTVQGQELLINEIQYSNKSIHFSSDSITPDWIEIYNAGAAAINVKGYQLSDKFNEDEPYILPDTVIAPNDYLLVLATDGDEDNSPELYSGFKLKLMKDTVLSIQCRQTTYGFYRSTMRS